MRQYVETKPMRLKTAFHIILSLVLMHSSYSNAHFLSGFFARFSGSEELNYLGTQWNNETSALIKSFGEEMNFRKIDNLEKLMTGLDDIAEIKVPKTNAVLAEKIQYMNQVREKLGLGPVKKFAENGILNSAAKGEKAFKQLVGFIERVQKYDLNSLTNVSDDEIKAVLSMSREELMGFEKVAVENGKVIGIKPVTNLVGRFFTKGIVKVTIGVIVGGSVIALLLQPADAAELDVHQINNTIAGSNKALNEMGLYNDSPKARTFQNHVPDGLSTQKASDQFGAN